MFSKTRLAGLMTVLAIGLLASQQCAQAQSLSDDARAQQCITQQNYVAQPMPPYNVSMSFSAVYPTYNMESSTQVFTTNGWQSSPHSGIAVGLDKVTLQLQKGLRFVRAYADYGNTASPAYCNFEWDGQGYLPMGMLFYDSQGKAYNLPLTGVFVTAYNPHQPAAPPLKGGK